MINQCKIVEVSKFLNEDNNSSFLSERGLRCYVPPYYRDAIKVGDYCIVVTDEINNTDSSLNWNAYYPKVTLCGDKDYIFFRFHEEDIINSGDFHRINEFRKRWSQFC